MPAWLPETDATATSRLPFAARSVQLSATSETSARFTWVLAWLVNPFWAIDTVSVRASAALT